MKGIGMAAGVNICVIDDDEAVRDSVKTLLAAADMPVETFGSAKEFLDGFDPARVGCVVADIRMPGMDGLELQAHLAGRCPGMPVIMITGHGDVPMAVKAMKAGAADFIEKPFDVETLIERIQRALETRDRDHQEVPVPPAEVRDRVGRLTPRERDVLRLLIRGEPNKVIAHALGISPRTVEIHRARIMGKMQIQNLPQLVRMVVAARLGPL